MKKMVSQYQKDKEEYLMKTLGFIGLLGANAVLYMKGITFISGWEWWAINLGFSFWTNFRD